MGFLRFRRSVRILPGVRVNVGKTGISTSIGGRGARVTLGHGHTRATVGLPGTGLSYTEVSRQHQEPRTGQQQLEPVADLPAPSAVRGWIWIALLVAIVVAIWIGTGPH